MNPNQLYRQDQSPTGLWECGVCSAVWPSEELAGECCACPVCGLAISPGKGHYSRTHSECWERRQAERAARLLKEAVMVSDWSGWVFAEGFPGGQDGYYSDLDQLVDALYGDDIPPERWPTRVHICETVPFGGIDPDSVFEQVTEEMFEDAYDHLTGVKEFRSACATFNAANGGLVTYTADYKRAVAVPPWQPKCPQCLGQGLIEPAGEVRLWPTCPSCGGTGRVAEKGTLTT